MNLVIGKRVDAGIPLQDSRNGLLAYRLPRYLRVTERQLVFRGVFLQTGATGHNQSHFKQKQVYKYQATG
jgi:hypothetical protein